MKKIISLVIVCVVLFSLCACSSEPTLVGSNGGNNNPSSEATEFKVGDTVKLNDVEVTFIGVTEDAGSTYFKPADGKIFVFCEFEISNKSNKDLAVSSMMSFQAYCDDYTCDLSISALAAKGEKEQLDGTVAAGKKMKGVVGYELPIDWTELEVHYIPDLLSSNKIVFVANNNA